MAGKLRRRASYQADAGYLIKLAEVIERDTTIAPSDRREIITSLNGLGVKLLKIRKEPVHSDNSDSESED